MVKGTEGKKRGRKKSTTKTAVEKTVVNNVIYEAPKEDDRWTCEFCGKSFLKDSGHACSKAPKNIEENFDVIAKSEEVDVISKEEDSLRAQKNKLFHNLEEDRINLNEFEREKEKERKLKEAQEMSEKMKKGTGKKFLRCPFCQNVQYEINSSDSTSAWCSSCGRCFSAIWQIS